MTLNFQVNKVRRLIATNGQTFTGKRDILDKYGESIGTQDISFVGVYHQTKSSITEKRNESSVTTSKLSPSILCLEEESKKVQKGDIIQCKGKPVKVVGMVDFNNMGAAIDIALEEVQDG